MFGKDFGKRTASEEETGIPNKNDPSVKLFRHDSEPKEGLAAAEAKNDASLQRRDPLQKVRLKERLQEIKVNIFNTVINIQPLQPYFTGVFNKKLLIVL